LEVFDLPTEDDLPFEDGRLRNFNETPQTELLTGAARPVLDAIHPDGRYLVGADSAIYYRVVKPFEKSKCVAPDWFYVPGVTQVNPAGRKRKSYLLWENRPPLIAIEYASNGGAEERDPTPDEGKFWAYESQIRPAYYAIFVPTVAQLEVYELVRDQFVPMRPNEAGRYPIVPMRMELGIWEGTIERTEDVWLRWWSMEGELLPSHSDRAEHQQRRAELEQQRADEQQRFAGEQQRRADEQQARADAAVADAERMRAMLRALGRDPDAA